MEDKPENIRAIVAETPYITGSATFLDGDTDLDWTVQFAPSGILRRVVCYCHTSEANLETVYFRIKVNDAIIVPAHWLGARSYIPVPPTGCMIDLDLNYPCASDTKFEVEINAAPTNGVSFIFTYEPMPIHRSAHKAMIRKYQTQLAEVST